MLCALTMSRSVVLVLVFFWAALSSLTSAPAPKVRDIVADLYLKGDPSPVARLRIREIRNEFQRRCIRLLPLLVPSVRLPATSSLA